MMVEHPMGNHLIQKLLKHEQSLVLAVEEYIKTRLRDLINHDHAGKVIKSLIEVCPSFCTFALQLITSEPSHCLATSSGAFVAIAVAKSCTEEEKKLLS